MTGRPDLLIVEDDEALAALLARAFTDQCERLRVVNTGADALLFARNDPPSLVLLDLGLPDVDGTSVCRELTGMTDTQVIVVTARDDPRIAEAVLDSGADDYVRKPFNLDELRARIRAAMRRRQPQPESVVRVGRLAIDLNQCVVWVDDEPKEVSATELRLLTYLARHPGWVFPKEQLLDSLWPGDRGTHAVQVHISNLRRKIEKCPSRPEIIITIKGLGYKLVP